MEDAFIKEGEPQNVQEMLLQYLNSFESYSSREDALKLLIRETIVNIAHQKGFAWLRLFSLRYLRF